MDKENVVHIRTHTHIHRGLPRWLSGKEASYSAEVTGDVGLIPGLGRYPGGGHGNPLWYSCLENLMVREAWWSIDLQRVTEATYHTHM